MSERIALLKPGLLVSLKTTLRGGVKYEKVDLNHERNGVTEVEEWQTRREVADVTEWQRGTECRSKASNAIRRACVATDFGLLCPRDREAELDAGIEAARVLVDEFNASARYSRLGVFVVRGRIADSDAEAARAIADEVRGLLDQMQSGIAKLDVAAIRDAANRARSLGAVLTDGQRAGVERAIDAARSAARKIVARVEKAGEDAQVVLAEINSGPIEAARFAFLDIAEGGEVAPEPIGPVLDAGRVAGIEVPELEGVMP